MWDLLSSSAAVGRAGFGTVELEEARVTIVMGADQHRAQITVKWIDTDTGEISRARVAPADRAGVRSFWPRFRGQKLEVALEATMGWRFVVEELHAIDARVHLAEPAETAGLLGSKKRTRGASPLGHRSPVGMNPYLEVALDPRAGSGPAGGGQSSASLDDGRSVVSDRPKPTLLPLSGELEISSLSPAEKRRLSVRDPRRSLVLPPRASVGLRQVLPGLGRASRQSNRNSGRQPFSCLRHHRRE
jgi:hypothetical protein